MNFELRRTIVQSEGRFLSEQEAARIREYALNMKLRIACARRIQEAEDEIVKLASERFAKIHAEYLSRVQHARLKVERDYRLTLRYVAAGHVRDDMNFFRRSYAQWIAELLRPIVAQDVLVDGQICLKEACDERLDALDARAVLPFLDCFIEELRK